MYIQLLQDNRRKESRILFEIELINNRKICQVVKTQVIKMIETRNSRQWIKNLSRTLW